VAGKRLVLVVDDEPDTCESLQAVLEPALRCPVVTFQSAPEALLMLELLTEDEVGLILSDYRMAPMDGLAFLNIVQKSHPSVPRVLATAFPDMDVAIQALNSARISQFLRKPLNPQVTVDLARELTSHHARQTRTAAAFGRALRHTRKAGTAGRSPTPPEGRDQGAPGPPTA
jgi:DNA-binding NtrC family response regulator